MDVLGVFAVAVFVVAATLLLVMVLLSARGRPEQPPRTRQDRLVRGVYGGGARGYQRYLLRRLRAGRYRRPRR